jgi:hypothetical protein
MKKTLTADNFLCILYFAALRRGGNTVGKRNNMSGMF